MRRPTTDNAIENGDGNTQVGQNSGTVISGMDPALFVEEMRRKDARIDELIARNEALMEQVNSLEREKIEAKLADLRATKEGLAARLAQPEQAFQEHKSRATRIEALLSDIATQQAVGENRIRSALEGFADLEYDEIDGLLQDVEQQGIMLAANAAFGRGLVAEDAIKWADAAAHYARAARLNPDYEALSKASDFAERSGDYAAAVQKSAALLALVQDEGSTQKHASALNEHALNNHRLGRYAEAEKLYYQALEITGVTLGAGHPDYANHLNNLAGVVQAQGRPAEAEDLYRQALEITRATLGEAHPEYATGLNNLAGAVQAQGRHAEAEKLLRQALKITCATMGEGHPSYATRLNNLAVAVQDQGRQAEAEDLTRQALKIDRATLGEEHPEYAKHLANLAGVVQDQGRHAEAEDLYRQALGITRATIGEAHPDYAIRLGNLGSLLGAQGKIKEAREKLAQAKAIFEKALPPDHPHIAEAQRHIDALGVPKD